VGGLAASWVALNVSGVPSALLIALSVTAGAAAGASWAGLAAAIRLKRGVHEVLCTLLLNFVGTLLVS
jgi:simple sugar transport system permease protein